MTPKASREVPSSGPRIDKERETREAVIKDADDTDGKDRDQVHGDGSTIDIQNPKAPS